MWKRGAEAVIYVWQEKLEGVKGVSLGIFSALMLALSAKVKIYLPFTPVPITAQTLALFLIALFLRGFLAPLAVSFYLLFGMLGLPYFAGSTAGISYLFGPTGGYLIGFLIAAWMVSRWASPSSFWKTFFVLILANFIIYALGVLWLSHWVGGLKKAICLGMLPFISGDLLKILLAVSIYRSVYGFCSARRFKKNS